MPRAVARNRWIGADAPALVPVACIGTGVRGLAIVGVDDMAGAAAGGTVVTRLVVRAEEPHQRIVEARLGQVDQRHRDAPAGAGSAVRRADVGAARLVKGL